VRGIVAQSKSFLLGEDQVEPVKEGVFTAGWLHVFLPFGEGGTGRELDVKRLR
jgi:hypothetical protein